MNDREIKVENLKLQLGSLKDELRDTDKAVEERHTERDALAKEIVSLSDEKGVKEKELIELRRSNAEEEHRHQSEITKLENEHKAKLEESQRVIASIVSTIVNSALKKISLKDSIELLKKDEERLGVLKSELATMEVKKVELENASVEFNQVSNELKERTEELRLRKSALKDTEERIQTKKRELAKWLKSKKDQAKQVLSSVQSLEKDWYRKSKDLSIVESRLKRKWKVLNPDVPFPKI